MKMSAVGCGRISAALDGLTANWHDATQRSTPDLGPTPFLRFDWRYLAPARRASRHFCAARKTVSNRIQINVIGLVSRIHQTKIAIRIIPFVGIYCKESSSKGHSAGSLRQVTCCESGPIFQTSRLVSIIMGKHRLHIESYQIGQITDRKKVPQNRWHSNGSDLAM
jgi:hypothetical protein